MKPCFERKSYQTLFAGQTTSQGRLSFSKKAQHISSQLILLSKNMVQVFDSGLIGEGVLHMLAWAKAKLLTEDAVLVSRVQSCLVMLRSTAP